MLLQIFGLFLPMTDARLLEAGCMLNGLGESWNQTQSIRLIRIIFFFFDVRSLLFCSSSRLNKFTSLGEPEHQVDLFFNRELSESLPSLLFRFKDRVYTRVVLHTLKHLLRRFPDGPGIAYESL